MMAEARDTEELVFDLVVVGGGLAGLCAALAAARAGARTALVQDRPVLGGNSSSEIRVVPYGAGHSNAWARETGLVGELILEDRATNPDQYLDHGLTNSNYDLTLLHAARRESHLTLFLNTSVRAVEVEEIAPVVSSNEASVSRYERRIVSVSGSQLGSEREYCFRARHFIDATGDGTVGFLAGADYRYGREARAEHGEPLAPATADEVTMGSTLTFRAHDTGKPAPFVAPLAAYPYRTPEDFIYDRGFWGVEQPAFGGYWWIEICNPYHQIADNPTVRDELHRHVLGIWDYLKNHSPQREHLATYALDWIGMLPGKRESRRLLGDVIVTEHDCHRDREWPDGVCYAGWWIDLHIPGGLLNRVDPGEREDVDQNYKHWIRVAPFSLPLRALYSRNVENLWMTGRDVSVTHVALGPMRVQLSLGAQGQAVGTAAAYAVAHDLTPREAAHPPGTHLSVIRQQLLREDVRLLGVPNEDPADLALRAEATATSAAGLDFGEPDVEGWVALDRDRGQVVPLTDERLETVEYYLRNSGEQTVDMHAEVHEMQRIWDREEGRRVAEQSFMLPAGFEGWVRVPFACAVRSGKPHRLVLRAAEGVAWAPGSCVPVGTVMQYLHRCPGGCEEKNRALPGFQPGEVEVPAYEHWWQIPGWSFAVRPLPQPRPYEAENVNNGWAWPEAMPNVWISAPGQDLPQAIELRFSEPVNFDTVRVSFDTDLQLETSRRPGYHRVPQCVRDWRLWVEEGGQWKMVLEETGNYQRRRVARFAACRASAVKLEVLAMNGPGEAARVYEVRIEG